MTTVRDDEPGQLTRLQITLQDQFGKACIRCPMLRPDPAQRGRFEEIRDNLLDRIAEAEREAWAGEAEGLRISLTGARDKLSQIATTRPVNLGIPTFYETTGRHNEPA